MPYIASSHSLDWALLPADNVQNLMNIIMWPINQ